MEHAPILGRESSDLVIPASVSGMRDAFHVRLVLFRWQLVLLHKRPGRRHVRPKLANQAETKMGFPGCGRTGLCKKQIVGRAQCARIAQTALWDVLDPRVSSRSYTLGNVYFTCFLKRTIPTSQRVGSPGSRARLRHHRDRLGVLTHLFDFATDRRKCNEDRDEWPERVRLRTF